MVAETKAPLHLPRGLIFMASLWLIGSWLVTIGVKTPIQPVSASYTPAVRMMLLCLVIGLMIGWPVLRLSQHATARPIAQTLLDLVVLLALTQVVIWPLRLVTPWTVARTAAIDATLSGWVLLTGAIVASAVGSSVNGVRTLAMVVCLGLCLLGPALAAWGPVGGVDTLGLIGLSPLMAVHTLGQGGGAPISAEQWRWIALLGGTVGTVWIVLLVVLSRAERHSRPPAEAGGLSSRV
jgi:hypothetical protein